MNNFLKTNAILTSIMLVAGMSLIPSAFSLEYPLSGSDGTHDVCIIASDFNGVKLNGNTNRGTTIAPLVENGLDEVSDNTLSNNSSDSVNFQID